RRINTGMSHPPRAGLSREVSGGLFTVNCRTIAASLLLLALPLSAQQARNSEAEQALKRLRPPKGLQASLFAAEPDFVNPVAFTFDEKGRAYVVATHSIGNCTYDIRGHMAWVDDDLASRTVADREAMHRKYLG